MHIQKKETAMKLRKKGKSYSEIMKILNLPSKGTLSVWFKGINLPDSAKKKLFKNVELSRKRGLYSFNNKRSRRVKAENKKLYIDASRFFSHFSIRDLALMGAALYWGEGYKSAKHPKLSFTNSDPDMICIFLLFIRKFLRISDSKIRTHIHIHSNLDERDAIKFWAEITKISPHNFRIVRQISIASKGKRPINILPHGTLDLRINSRQLYFTMMGLIQSIIKTASEI